MGMLTGKESVYLAALDAEKLRRRGAGSGVDAMQASESWLARDCLCSSSGKLKPLTSLRGPGEVKLTVAPVAAKGETEACVLLRAVAIRNIQDPHDWHVLGSAVVLKVDVVGKLQQPGNQLPRQQLLDADPSEADELCASPDLEDFGEDDDGKSQLCGVPLQTLVDFQSEIQVDLERYCTTHRLCAHDGRYRSYHVCMMDPCPYRPINKARFDDHRGVLFVQRSALDEEENEALEKLAPDMHIVVRRYVWPSENGPGKSCPLLPDPQRPPKIGTYVAHSWAEPFAEFVQTLQRALDREDTVFVPGLMMGNGAVIHGRSGGSGELEQRPFVSALRKAERLIVVADRACAFLHCLWCAFEILKAKEWLMPTFVWPHHSTDIGRFKDAIGRLDLHTASQIVPSAGAAPTAESEELRRLLVAAIRGTSPDLEACSLQLRALLQCRIQCFVSAMQQVNEFRDFNPERLWRICADHEHRATMRETGRQHSRCVEEMEAEAQEHDKVLARLSAALDAEREALKTETQSMHETLAEQREAVAKEEAVMRTHLSEESTTSHRMEADLQDARVAIKRLRSELEAERNQSMEDSIYLAEAQQQAEMSSERAQEIEARWTERHAEDEQQAFMRESKCKALELQLQALTAARQHAQDRASKAEEEAQELAEKLREAEVSVSKTAEETDDIELRSSGSGRSGSRSLSGVGASLLKMPTMRSPVSNFKRSMTSNESLGNVMAQSSTGSRASAFASGAAKFFMGGHHKDAHHKDGTSSASTAGDKVKHVAGSLLSPLTAGKSTKSRFGLSKGVGRCNEEDGPMKIDEQEDADSDPGGSSAPVTPIQISESCDRNDSGSKELPVARRKSAGAASSGAFNLFMKLPGGGGGGGS